MENWEKIFKKAGRCLATSLDLATTRVNGGRSLNADYAVLISSDEKSRILKKKTASERHISGLF